MNGVLSLVTVISLMNLNIGDHDSDWVKYFVIVMDIFLAALCFYLAIGDHLKSKYKSWKLDRIKAKREKEAIAKINEYARKLTEKENYFK